MRTPTPWLPLETTLLKAGMRLAAGVSGGADSVALLRALACRSAELGVMLSVAHLHHGLRGAEAEADLQFVRALAARLSLPFHFKQIDTAAEAARLPGKPAETIEEAARRLRYAWFRELMASGVADAVATAHTLDDQAETVLAKLLRGAWTEGMAGIHPVVDFPEGPVIRPILAATRAQVEAYLHAQDQPWREDSSNRHLTFTRNRIRHELLPQLESWNPRLREHLAQMAELARDEESWWQAELARLAPQVILTGRPVRGGGRAAAADVSLDLGRLAGLHPAVQRRLIRHAARRLGASPDFRATEELRELALAGRAGQRCELAGGLRGIRTHRELRLSIQAVAAEAQAARGAIPVAIAVPGDLEAPEFGLRVTIECDPPGSEAPAHLESSAGPPPAMLRYWKPGDRVHMRHSSGPRKVKEVLERMKVSGEARARWPVVEWGGQIVWMQGVAVEAHRGIRVSVSPLQFGPGAKRDSASGGG